MFRAVSSRQTVVVGLVSCLFLAGTGDVIAQPKGAVRFEDIVTAIREAEKALKENRSSEVIVDFLTNALNQARKFKPSAKDYIRESSYWAFLNPPDASKAIEAADNAIRLDPNAAEAYAVKGYVYYKVMIPLSYESVNKSVENLKKSLFLKTKYLDPVDKNWADNANGDLFDALINVLKKYDIAVGVYEDLASVEPDNPSFQYGLGIAHWKGSNYALAADAFRKSLENRPSDWRCHDYYMTALKKSSLDEAIMSYVKLAELLPREPAVKLGLAKLYLENDQKQKALPLLAQVRNSLQETKSGKGATISGIEMRMELARAFARAEDHVEAIRQFQIVLPILPQHWFEEKINLTYELGKAEVAANKLKEGTFHLKKALEMNGNLLDPFPQQQMMILFELGNGLRLSNEKKLSEKYFRDYLQVLQDFALTRRTPDNVKTAEMLGDICREDGNYREAVEAYKGAMVTYKALTRDEQVKYPGNRVQYSLAEALLKQGLPDEAIPQAKELLADKEYGLKARRLLAQAYLQLDQDGKALDYLGELKNTDLWDHVTMRFMAQALLAKRPLDALKYIEQAEQAAQKQTDDELTLLHAKVLVYLDRPNEAKELYKKVLQDRPNSYKTLLGLGDLEMRLAGANEGTARLAHLVAAVKHLKEAHDLHRSDSDILGKLGQAEQEHARADAELQVRNDRFRVVLYTCGLLLAALIPIGFMVYIYRQQWALHCFREVCDLERDLIQTIRDRVKTRWLGDWDHLGDEAFRGRLDYKSLRNRAEKDGAKDVLGVANFGHLVGIVDAGWEALGFKALCAQEMADPKEVIIANLSYVSSCRTCLAHFGKLDEMTRGISGGALKAHLSQHLHRQVKTSLRIIRARFRLGAQAEPDKELPVLTPVKQGAARGP